MSINDADASTSSSHQAKQSAHPLHQYKKTGNIVPIVYKANYNITFCKMENLHPFDSKKWGRIADILKDYFTKKHITVEFPSPDHPITNEELAVVHTGTFICKINYCKLTVVRATEVPLLFCLPMCLIRRRILTPLKWQTAGSVLAGYLAMQHGYAINLGGGFHHCSAKSPGGFCLFADITLTIRYLWQEVNPSLKVLIVDLDAHQGNGHERDVLAMPKEQSDKIYTFDMFNVHIYPWDTTAKAAISRMVELGFETGDEKYLSLLKYHMDESLADFNPDFIIYNAGTDILDGDPLGGLSVSPKGVEMRDEIVFTAALRKHIPILMLTSGGYQLNNAQVIANSLINLFEKGIVSLRL